MKQQFIITHANRQTEIPTLLDSLVTNTPSVKLLRPQKNCLSLHFCKYVTCLSVGLFRISQVFQSAVKMCLKGYNKSPFHERYTRVGPKVSGLTYKSCAKLKMLWGIYRMSQEECARLRESVPYVKLYRYNPKHLYPKLNGYGDNGHQKVWASGVSTYCTPSVTSYSSTAHARQRDMVTQWPWRMLYSTVALTSQDKSQLQRA